MGCMTDSSPSGANDAKTHREAYNEQAQLLINFQKTGYFNRKVFVICLWDERILHRFNASMSPCNIDAIRWHQMSSLWQLHSFLLLALYSWTWEMHQDPHSQQMLWDARCLCHPTFLPILQGVCCVFSLLSLDQPPFHHTWIIHSSHISWESIHNVMKM